MQRPTEPYRHIALDEVGSTNDVAFEYALEGESGPLWVTAARQLKGRGRLGSHWVSDTGNLYASLLIRPNASTDLLPQLPLVASVALHRALSSLVPAERTAGLRIKWPNDILLDRSKVAGILAESRTLSGQGTVVVLGFGVNCASHPPVTRHPASNLAALGIALAPAPLFDALAGMMAATLALWDGGAGFGAVRERWLEAAAHKGEMVVARLPDRQVEGRFAGLDGAGRLLLQAAAGTEAISAGEIFFTTPDAKDHAA